MSSSGGGNKSKELLTIGEVKERQLGQSDKADYFTTCATTMHIKPENLAYPACPSEGCNKKVIEAEGQWRCEKCDKSYERPEYRFVHSYYVCQCYSYSLDGSYIISMAVADITEQAWLQGFNDVGNALFGVPANTLMEAKVFRGATMRDFTADIPARNLMKGIIKDGCAKASESVMFSSAELGPRHSM